MASGPPANAQRIRPPGRTSRPALGDLGKANHTFTLVVIVNVGRDVTRITPECQVPASPGGLSPGSRASTRAASGPRRRVTSPGTTSQRPFPVGASSCRTPGRRDRSPHRTAAAQPPHVRHRAPDASVRAAAFRRTHPSGRTAPDVRAPPTSRPPDSPTPHRSHGLVPGAVRRRAAATDPADPMAPPRPTKAHQGPQRRDEHPMTSTSAPTAPATPHRPTPCPNWRRWWARWSW